MASTLTTPLDAPSVPSAVPSSSAAPRVPPRMPPPPPKRPLTRIVRNRLSNAQKLELCEYATSHPTLAWDELAMWAKKRFRLRKPISTSTVYHALRRHEALKQLSGHELEACRTSASAVYHEFQRRLRDWIVQMAGQGLHLDCKIIQAEAHRLRAELDDGTLQKHSFSNGWLASFMDRNDLSLTNLRKGGSVVAPERTRRKYTRRVTSMSTATTQ